MEENILLEVLAFTSAELECLIKTAIKLSCIDGVADIEEWNLLTLVPALLEIEQENAPEELKAQWQEKLQAVSRAMEEQDPDELVSHLKITETIRDKEKRETFIALLFMIGVADQKLDKLEVKFILDNTLRPWGLGKKDLLYILNKKKGVIPRIDEIIEHLSEFAF